MKPLMEYSTALTFLEKIEIKDAEELIGNDPLSFLGILIERYQEHLPFQCVSILAQSKEEKHVPALEEVVNAGLGLEGGLCFTLNTFMCILLRTLGFKADVLDGSYSTHGDTHTHVVVLLKDLRCADDDFIIDVGTGYPFEAPISLSEVPCTRYCAGQEYRYERKGNSIWRLHRPKDELATAGEIPIMHGEWRKMFHFDLVPVTFDHFRPYMENIYINDSSSDFHSTIRAVRFPPSRDRDQKRIMVAFKDNTLLFGPMDAAQKTHISDEDLADKIKENFPTIPPSKVDLAVRNWIGMKKNTEK
ncbi:uncharacterized protein [Palaemon carinicauda]|uniref:uncharacterized protein n=1 Tax=Palaemon carinicauda TaxID=392227 RepID=UPI0035B685E3